MTRIRTSAWSVAAAALGLGLVIGEAQAWWGYVHYRIAKDVAGVDADYAMGPDVFASYHSISWDGIGVISTEFNWSHAVMAEDLDFPPPEIPQYPHDGRFPGREMHDLVTKKLKPATLSGMQGGGAGSADPLKTAIGFMAHNAADNIVHWAYFLGGNTPGGCGNVPGLNSLWMWQTNHGSKEEWCNYVVLMLKDARTNGGAGAAIQLFQGPGEDGVMGTTDDIFSSLTEDANGNGQLDDGEDQDGNTMLTDYTNDVFAPLAGGQRRLQQYLINLHPLALKSNVRLQHLGMKVFRKNRRNTDFNGAPGTNESSEFSVSNVAAIQNSFTAEITNSATRDLVNMTLARFNALNMIASDVNNRATFGGCTVSRWHPTDVMMKYTQCVTRATAWVANAGN